MHGCEGTQRSTATEGARRKLLSTLHPNTILMPTPTLSLTLTKTEYWDRAGGGRNIVQETSTTNEVSIGKWMRAAQKGLKMGCIHPFGHHN